MNLKLYEVARRTGPFLTAVALLGGGSSAMAYDWFQFNGDAAHSGNNVLEKGLTKNNVTTLTKLYQVSLPAVADGAPVFLRNVATPSGIKDLLFVTTKAADIVALDADNGSIVWSKSLAVTGCNINTTGGPCYTTSSPAIDPNRLYVYSYGLDGNVHKFQVGDGTEIMTGGWPALATTKGFDEKGSSALAFATSGAVTYLYMTHGGYPGDNGDYQGHVAAINIATGSQKVFNMACSNQAVHLLSNRGMSPPPPTCSTSRNAVWPRAAVVYDAGTDSIFLSTGNGVFDADTGGFNWSESIIALHSDASSTSGAPLDSYTPVEVHSLDSGDTDVGSTAITIIPTPPNSNVQHLAVQSGKDGKLRLVNLANLSGQGGPRHTGGEIGSVIGVPQGGGVFSQIAVWINPRDSTRWVFVANGSGISGLQLQIDVSGNPSLHSQWSSGTGGTSPLIANNVLYSARGGGFRALDPTTGTQLWSSSQIGGVHWESPLVIDGAAYVTDESGKLTAFTPSYVPTYADFSASGRAGLVWRNSATGESAMWLMNGITQTASATLVSDPNWTITQIGDFNGDDKYDIVWRNSSIGQTAIWLMNGTTFVSGGTVMADPNWVVTHVGDFNGDGNTDLVWRNSSTGQTAIWLMNGATFASGATIMADPNWSVTQVGDFNGDGKTDLLWRNSSTGQTAIWLMNGLSFISGGTVLGDANWSVIQVGDFDGDGKSDLLWHNSSTGATAIWLMNGISLASGGTMLIDPNWSVVKIGDFNGDGRSDLVWRNASSGQTAIWLMNGLAFGSGGTILVDPNWSVTNIGDFNGDGNSDLIWRNSATGATVMWVMNGATLSTSKVLQTDANWSVVTPSP